MEFLPKGRMQPFDCLDTNLSLQGNYFLEASAGTGKTFAIEHVVCRLILSGMSASEILLTTFTKASTRDLRLRIYETLKNTDTLLAKEMDDAPSYVKEIEDKRAARLLVKNALSQIDEMHIFTICSFCYRMLSEYAFEANIDFHLEDPENEEKKGQMALAVLDVLRTTVDEDRFSVAQIQKLMASFNKEVPRFVRKMVSLLEQDAILPEDFIPYQDYLSVFLEELKDIDPEKLQSDLHLLAPLYKKVCKKDGEIHEFVQNQFIALANKDLETLIRAPLSIFTLFQEENLKQKKQFDRSNLFYPNLLKKIAPIVEEASNPQLIFLEMAKMAKGRIQEREITNPSFFLEAMLNATEIETFRDHLRKQYRALIIDEFQDTDPLSWKVFHTLFFGQVELFLVVGDPKQSIYAFRGADLQTYLRAKNTFSKTYALTTNYRSSKEMIHILNTLFSEEKVPGLFSFSKDSSSLHYYAIQAGKKDPGGLSVHFPIFSGPAKPRGPFPTIEMEEDLIFPYLAREIQALTKEGFDLGDIAILVKDRFASARLLDYLQKEGLSVLSSATSSIQETEAFSLLSTLFQINQNPRSINLIKQALIHPLISWPTETLTQGIQNSEMQQLIVLFSELKITFEQKGISMYLRHLLDMPFPERPLIEIIAKDPDSYSDIMQIIGLVLESNQEDPLEALEEIANKEVDENPELKRKPLMEETSLSILTSHMSKGLEYKIVFALGIGSRTTTKLDLIKDTKGHLRIFKEEDHNCKEALVASDMEKMRLFYVALTRAKERLYIISPIDTNEKEPHFGSASPIELYFARLLSPTFLEYDALYKAIPYLTPEKIASHLKKIEISSEIISTVEMQKEELEEIVVDIKNPVLLEPLEKRVQFLSFSSMPNPNQPLEHSKIEPTENELPFGPEIGSLFHLLFEKIIEEGIYYLGDDLDLQAFVEKELIATPLFDWREEVFTLIQKAFTTMIAPKEEEPFCLKEIPPSSLIQEMQFSYPVKKNELFMKGFIDLFFHHNGKYYLLDWKLTRLPSYTKETIESAMKEHNYFLQAEIYTKALSLHLQNQNLLPFEDHFGGFIYFFLRGQENGLYHFNPRYDYELKS